MKSTITFGKYKDSTPEQLKRIDIDYLTWGAANLRSPKWRNEFQEALDSVTELDREFAQWELDRQNVLSMFAVLLDCDGQKLDGLARRFSRLDDNGNRVLIATQKNFTTQRKFELFRDFVAGYGEFII